MRGQRLVAALMTALLAGCGPAVATSDPVPAAVGPAPMHQYAVGMRQFTLDPDGRRPLPVTVWYPAAPSPTGPAGSGAAGSGAAGSGAAGSGTAGSGAAGSGAAGSGAAGSGLAPVASGSDEASALPSRPSVVATPSGPGRATPANSGPERGPRVRPGAPFAAGRFPVVLYSHGLRSLPALHAALTSRWAAAGFVVVAPTYPRTNQRARAFTRDDVRNQPADAWRLVRHLVRLGARPGDPLGAHMAVDRFAAAGHSAGGHTTLGMFASGQPFPVRAGIVIAGGRMVAGPSRPLAPMLFVHGSADRIVPESIGRAAYARCLGPAAFLSLTGQGHGEYLTPGRPGFAQVFATTTDFLRWTLYGDREALHRLPADAKAGDLTTLTTRALPT
ncbi:alpha/beta hydrolase [Micromonospora sp. C28ISP2-4]|uniref:alpha/beta hydrolase family protein n=1 Tax=Micromonospora sp. C28ISP2-4 TaxID=3059523 RepID=UPI002674A708|nr:alpha/beta hydrolase [Micromonospora sp. C28ISP2-4]MDO3684240.1 alpha/beta hydrolase [Micromonospora sp. C28ISP2-4]